MTADSTTASTKEPVPRTGPTPSFRTAPLNGAQRIPAVGAHPACRPGERLTPAASDGSSGPLPDLRPGRGLPGSARATGSCSPLPRASAERQSTTSRSSTPAGG